MATGESFTRIWAARQDARRDKLITDADALRAIDREISRLQNEREALYLDDGLTDDELKMLVNPIDAQISKLIDSKYQL